jgi:hypothetical protein
MAVRTVCPAFIMTLLSTAVVARQPDAFDICAQDKDSTTRLACFDREVAARNAAAPAAARTAGPVAPPAGPVAPPAGPAAPPATRVIAAPAAASTSTSDVGLDALQRRQQREERGESETLPPALIEAEILKVIPRQPSISAFELDNGQIWEQSEAMRMAPEPKQKVTIRQGVLGAFFLKTADGTVVRVHRVR